MKTIDLDDATASLSDYAKHVHETPVIVTRNGKPVAALVSLENADLESVSLANNPAFLTIVERSRTQYRQKGGLSREDIDHELNPD